MSTELLARSKYELDDDEHIAPSPDTITSFALQKVVYIKKLEDNPGFRDEAWQHIKQRLIIKNHLQENDLNTPEEDTLAEEIIKKHGLTKENYKDYFDSAFEAGDLVSAYEIVHDDTRKN